MVTTSSKLIRLAAVLAAGIALIATGNIASANDQRHASDGISMRSDHSMSGMNQDGHHKHKKEKYTRKKNCLYITSDGKRCGEKPVKTMQPKKDCRYITADGKRCGTSGGMTGGAKTGGTGGTTTTDNNGGGRAAWLRAARSKNTALAE